MRYRMVRLSCICAVRQCRDAEFCVCTEVASPRMMGAIIRLCGIAWQSDPEFGCFLLDFHLRDVAVFHQLEYFAGIDHVVQREAVIVVYDALLV